MVGEANAHDRARVVRRYLSALDAQRLGRSAGKTAESVAHRMHQIDTEMLSADPVRRLHLTQERIDLHSEHLRLTTGSNDISELEKAFVRVARGYGDRHGISFSAWRQIGVEADVLAAAGIKQATKPGRATATATASAPAAPEEAASTATEALPPSEGASEPAKAAAPAPAKKAAKKKSPAAKKTAPAKKAPAKKAAAPKIEQPNLLS